MEPVACDTCRDKFLCDECINDPFGSWADYRCSCNMNASGNLFDGKDRAAQLYKHAQPYKELANVNVERNNHGIIPYCPFDDKKMTFWSRYDPVSQPRSKSDHWSKMKQRAVQYRSLDNPRSIGFPMSLDRTNPQTRVHGLHERLFDDFVADALDGNMPGSYMYSRPRNCVSRESVRSAFNERAKEGFRYWLIEKPKPTNFGKYGLGSYKTVLGVGNAPRT